MNNQKVDIVYSWSGIPDKNTRRSDSPQRYRYNNELKYSIRSLFKYAQWINHIYILINPTTTPPYWLKDDKKITIINRCKLFDNKHNCPTYNSMAVHAICHKIEGLAEHFIIFDDDIFLKNNVDISYFFNQSGLPIVRQPYKKTRIALELWEKAFFSSGLKNNIKKFPEYKFASHSHRPKPMSIGLIDMFNKEYPGVSELIQSHVYRTYGLEFMTDMIYYEFLYNLGLIDYRQNDKTFVQFGVSENFNEISFRNHSRLINQPNIKCFNINDNWSLDSATYSRQMDNLSNFFEETFPEKPDCEI